MEPNLRQPDLTQQLRQAHALLDVLSAEKLTAVRSLLEVIAEPLSRSLALAEVEDEEITSETAASLDSARASLARGEDHRIAECLGRCRLDSARASLARGEGIPHGEILREFGIR